MESLPGCSRAAVCTSQTLIQLLLDVDGGGGGGREKEERGGGGGTGMERDPGRPIKGLNPPS